MVMKLPKSVYYYWVKHMDHMINKDHWLVEKIKAIVEKHKGRYGYRRIQTELEQTEGVRVNHKRLLRLMKRHNLLCQKFRNKSRQKYSSYKGTVGKVAPNHVNRDFNPEQPNQLWVTDVTEFALPIEGRKLYLSTIMDCFNSEIIAYKVSHSPSLDIVIDPLRNALNTHQSHLNQLVVHSDQGFQYQNKQWQKVLEQFDAGMSMSRKGNCLDNSPMENFFGLLKQEMFYGESFNSYKDLEEEIHEYINYYNKHRIKTKLKGMSPEQFRKHTLELA